MPTEQPRYMVLVGDEWPLATGYDRYGDPEGYIFGTLEEAGEYLKDRVAGGSEAVYAITKVYDDSEE